MKHVPYIICVIGLMLLITLPYLTTPSLADNSRQGLPGVRATINPTPASKTSFLRKDDDNTVGCRACLDSIDTPWDTTGTCLDLEWSDDAVMWVVPSHKRWPADSLTRRGTMTIFALNAVGADTILFRGVDLSGIYGIFDAADSADIDTAEIKPFHPDTTQLWTIPDLDFDNANVGTAQNTQIALEIEGAYSGGTAIRIDGNPYDAGLALDISSWDNETGAIAIESANVSGDSVAAIDLDITGTKAGTGIKIDVDDATGSYTGLWVSKNGTAVQDSTADMIRIDAKTDLYVNNGSTLRGLSVNLPVAPQDTSLCYGIEIAVEDTTNASRALYVSAGDTHISGTSPRDSLIVDVPARFTDVVVMEDSLKQEGGIGYMWIMGPQNAFYVSHTGTRFFQYWDAHGAATYIVDAIAANTEMGCVDMATAARIIIPVALPPDIDLDEDINFYIWYHLGDILNTDNTVDFTMLYHDVADGKTGGTFLVNPATSTGVTDMATENIDHATSYDYKYIRQGPTVLAGGTLTAIEAMDVMEMMFTLTLGGTAPPNICVFQILMTYTELY